MTIDPVNENHEVHMQRDDLEAIPVFSLPSGFELHWFVPGDESHWRQINAAADVFNDIHEALFTQQFGDDEKNHRQRICFVRDIENAKLVGVAAAWWHTDDRGLIHWVAVLPEYQGRGLSKPLLSAVCHRLRELGHKRVFLGTASARIAALNLYLLFGFKPVIKGNRELEIWRALSSKLKCRVPDLECKF